MRAEANGRWAFALTVAAFAWGAALVVGAFVLPFYSVEREGPSGTVKTSETLIGENGLGVLLPVAVPAAVAALVWFALHRQCSRGSLSNRQVARLLIGLLAGFSFLAAASIGMYVIPVALLLAFAAGLTPKPEVRKRL